MIIGTKNVSYGMSHRYESYRMIQYGSNQIGTSSTVLPTLIFLSAIKLRTEICNWSTQKINNTILERLYAFGRFESNGMVRVPSKLSR